ncbi:MAG: LexA family transcriptional regulator [Bacteroidota bacterium]
MSKYQNHTVNQRFKAVYEALENLQLIKGKSDIANELGTYNHIINSILKGQRNITIDQLSQLFDTYSVNANYLFGLSDEMFTASGKLESRSMDERDFSGKPNITLIPLKALAGSAVPAPELLEEEHPQFSVPGMQGNLLAVEISGDSMMPTLMNGDIVICERIERDEPIRENQVYIIVTDTVVAKRVQQVKSNGTLNKLRLISDNSSVYQPYELDVQEILQLLKVKCRLTSHGMK